LLGLLVLQLYGLGAFPQVPEGENFLNKREREREKVSLRGAPK
jgi:hypothetical protein